MPVEYSWSDSARTSCSCSMSSLDKERRSVLMSSSERTVSDMLSGWAGGSGGVLTVAEMA